MEQEEQVELAIVVQQEEQVLQVGQVELGIVVLQVELVLQDRQA